MNYNLLMEQQIADIKEGKKLLLHACCAPCSSAVLERLGNFFDITVFYYNPNITEKNEYAKRVEELKKFINNFSVKYPIKLIEGNYDVESFFEISKGLEKEKERGARCFKCYELRLEETAKIAEELEFDYFATTLTLSPYKNVSWLNEIGENLDKKYSDYSIIQANYTLGNGVVTKIGVLGPERMDYAKIASALKYVVDEMKKD